jgi:hypothetical protein
MKYSVETRPQEPPSTRFLHIPHNTPFTTNNGSLYIKAGLRNAVLIRNKHGESTFEIWPFGELDTVHCYHEPVTLRWEP